MLSSVAQGAWLTWRLERTHYPSSARGPPLIDEKWASLQPSAHGNRLHRGNECLRSRPTPDPRIVGA
ncbi:hypothetical protein NDU88_003004 [Pleurodeles waltl]|uniref:Uncharacterized protein n=1 Tax=Pleurodeles waltl TaxID=8319 RepID=A0AAV7WRJ6_PLEWA|nr:hypothetical protein NDU88_003004 [Pleurodeles waltl]